jgi:hypothetical protein
MFGDTMVWLTAGISYNNCQRGSIEASASGGDGGGRNVDLTFSWEMTLGVSVPEKSRIETAVVAEG